MLHRLGAMFIVGFWIAMTALLVIREIYPDATNLNTIPVGHVGRLMFQHEQRSDLDIYDRDKKVGYISTEPGWSEDKKFRTLKLVGNTELSLPGAMHRISWFGTIHMDAEFRVWRLKLNLSTGQPVQQIDIEYDAATNTTNYTLKSDGVQYEQSRFTVDQDGILELLGRIGFGQELLAQFNERRAAMPPPEFAAVQSSVTLNGETISTYLLSMKVGGQTLWEAHMSNLGQVLKARAPIFGYKLIPEGLKQTH